MVCRDGNHIRIKFLEIRNLPERKKEYHKDIENMKKTLITILAAVPALICAGACTDFLYEGEVDLTPKEEEEEEEFVYPTTYEFNHPCAYVTMDDINRAKAAVAAADETDPAYKCWLELCNSKYAVKGYTANPVEILVRGDPTGTGVSSQNVLNAGRDAAAAFELALRYQISGDTDYATTAVKILNDWAATCKKITSNDADFNLAAGFQGYQFANAAELLRDYDGWAEADQNAFRQWLIDVWYSINKGFIDSHGGTNVCNLHYWSNWELANLASILAIGIYTENPEMITYVYRQFREGEGSGALHNMIPYAPVSDPAGLSSTPIAQCMESGRDQGHATLVSAVCAELCQMAWNIGIDFWGMEDNLVLSMFEYTAMYNSNPYPTVEMPFTEYSYCTGCECRNQTHGAIHTAVSSDGRGTIRPCWDLIYSHYKSAGLSDKQLHYTKQFAEQLRYTDGELTGDCGAGDSRYNNKDGAETTANFDQIGWGTLLFYQD